MVTKRQYYAIKNSLTPSEKELINYYETQWILRQYVPTLDEVITFLRRSFPTINHTTVNYYLKRPPVVKALDNRGIPWRQHTQEELTPTQVAAAVTVMNFADTRSINEKLDSLGINPSQYYAWLNDPTFKNMVDTLADRNLTNIRPTAIAEFTKKINQGDWNAVKFWLETTGELNGQGGSSQSEHMLRAIVEIIQEEVKDPEVIMRIAQRIKQASANRTLEVVTEQPAITGQVVDDVELENAKKQLGI